MVYNLCFFNKYDKNNYSILYYSSTNNYYLIKNVYKYIIHCFNL